MSRSRVTLVDPPGDPVWVLILRLPAVRVRRAALRLQRQGVAGIDALGAVLAARVAEIARAEQPRGRPRKAAWTPGGMVSRQRVEGETFCKKTNKIK